MITKNQYDILSKLETERYFSFEYFDDLGLTKKQLSFEFKELKRMGLVEYGRGLMDDEGMVAGSGYCIKYDQDANVGTLLSEYENVFTSRKEGFGNGKDGDLKITNKEIVICAAVKTRSGKIFRGHRHSDAIKAAHEEGWTMKDLGFADQGFITSLNRYVSREEGRKLQNEAGIKSADPEGYRGDTLFSEDLY